MKNLLLFCLCSFLATTTFAQWEKIYDIEDNNLYIIYADKYDKLLLGAERADVYVHDKNFNFDIKSLEPYGFVSDIEFIDDNVGYLSGGCYYVFDECPANTIYKTTNGGKSWNQILNYGGTGVFTLALAGNKIFALSEYEGLVVSEDGGATWTDVTIDPNLEHGRYQEIAFVNDNEGFVMIHKQETALYKTIDGGQSWSKIYDNSQQGENFRNFTFLNEDIGFINLSKGKYLKTQDGGFSWSTFSYTTNENEFTTKITFPTPTTGYLVSFDTEEYKGYIYRTDDGGDTWSVDYTYEDGIVGDIAFTDSENGYAIVSHRMVYRRSGVPTEVVTSLELQINPNPTSDAFTIKFTPFPNGDFSLRAIDALGRVIYTSQQITAPVVVSSWNPGVYFIEVRNHKKELIGRAKMVKQP